MLKTKYSTRHGGPYDRGSADSYYRRPFDPHYYKGNTYSSPRVECGYNTDSWFAYQAGYEENEAAGSYKY